MQFRFQPLRATQAASLLVRLNGGRLNYTKLIKLLHLADRQALVETGSPITGDRVVNMKHGPVLSNIYRCIKGEAPECESWSRYLRREDYDLVTVGDPGDSELAEYDVEVLEALSRKYQRLRYHEMIDVVHQLPEWEDPSPALVSSTVSPERILEAAGATPDTIQEYADLNASLRQLEAVRVIRT